MGKGGRGGGCGKAGKGSPGKRAEDDEEEHPHDEHDDSSASNEDKDGEKEAADEAGPIHGTIAATPACVCERLQHTFLVCHRVATRRMSSVPSTGRVLACALTRLPPWVPKVRTPHPPLEGGRDK